LTKSNCNNCKVFKKGEILKLICPYEENEIGLEKKKECRSKILELVLKNHLEFEKIHFLGNNIVKTYDKKILTKYINNVKFIYSKNLNYFIVIFSI
jgi:hypothetical protein